MYCRLLSRGRKQGRATGQRYSSSLAAARKALSTPATLFIYLGGGEGARIWCTREVYC